MDPSSSLFKPYEKYERCSGEKQKMLKNSIGRQIPYIVNILKSTVQIFDIELEKTTHSFNFPEGFQLVDVDYFPTITGQLGVILGVHDEQQLWGAANFAVALVAAPDEPTMTMTHATTVPTRITVVKTLFSAKDMQEGLREQSLGLYSKLLEWNHIVAIGCKESKCFLTKLNQMNAPVDRDSILIPETRKMLDLMNPFIKNGKLVYTHDEECFKDYPSCAVSVTALALMPRSRTLLVGLSMGGILAVALNPSNNMVFLELRHERLIRELAPLEPEDDPDKFEYFIAAVDRSSRHPIMIQLWRGSFNLKAGEAVDDAEKYNRPCYNACLEHKIPYGERWLAVSPIITERGLDGARRRDDSTMDSMLNVSQSYGCSYNRSHVLLAYEKQKPTSDLSPEFVVEASIFDIDAWYYKRVPGGVSTDGTVLRQCAFMSTIRSNIDASHVKDIGILSLDPNDVVRFSSLVSDADQLFYPSALSFQRVFVMEGGMMRAMRIQSIQQTILDKCAARISSFIRSPEMMSLDILAAGLVRKSILTGSPNSSAVELPDTELSTDQKVILNAMVYYGKMDEFCSLATRHELSDRIKMEIAEWAFHEAIDHKRTISDRTVTLFEGKGASLSPLAEGTLLQGVQLFLIVHEYLKTCSRTLKDGAKSRSMAHSIKCLGNHTRLVGQFIKFGIVPPDYRVLFTMREMHEKRKAVAFRNKIALPIQVVTRNMHRIAPGGQFWNEMPHEEWYPPTALDLLESVLNVNIPERFKRELIVQFVLDWLRADPAHSEDTEQQLALETIRVMTNNMLNVDREKIYYILDEERAALKRKEAEPGGGAPVFSLTDDGLSYEKLWSGEVLLNATIGKSDLEKFEQRLKVQEGKQKRLMVLDPETEKLYQVFLFEKQKYDLMSTEAIESNELLRSLLPGMIKKNNGVKSQKSTKEKEIEEAVRAMFERQEELEESTIPEVFAAIGEKGRKRRSEAQEGSENQNLATPESFVPPTAKRIQLATRIRPSQSEPLNESSTSSSMVSPTDPQRNAELNMLIATPARYYRRPMSVNTDMVSPPTQRLPPVPAQNSILKTAKAVQSPSRGRIRFHESVRKAINESTSEFQEEGDEEEEEEAPRPKQLDFAMLDEEKEEEIPKKRVLVTEAEPEVEKSFEQQEEFEVLEDTFEPRTDDVIPGAEETFELTENIPEEIVEKVQEEVLEKSDEQQEEIQDEVQEEAQQELLDKSEEKQDEEEVPEQVTKQQQDNDDDAFAEPTAPWDGIHRSFEVQNDEDCEPKEQEEEFEDANDELAEEVPLNRTFEIQEEEEPQPKGDGLGEQQEEAHEARELQELVQDEDRPPSACTRSATKKRTESRSVTPVEKEEVVQEEKKEEKKEEQKEEKTPKRTRARTVSKSIEPAPLKSSELQEEEEEVAPKEEKTPKRARARTVSKSIDPAPLKTSELQEEEEEDAPKEEKTPKRARARTVSKSIGPAPLKTSELQEEEEEDAPKEEKTPKRARARTVSKSIDPAPLKISELQEEEEEDAPKEEKTPKRARARTVSKSIDPAPLKISELQEEEEEVAPPARRTRASSVKRNAHLNPIVDEEEKEVEKEKEAEPKKSRAKSTSRPASRATTPSRSRAKKALEGEEPTTPTDPEGVLPDLTGSTLVKRVSAKRATSRAASVETPKAAPSAPSTPRRGRPPKSKTEASEVTPAKSSRAASKRRTPAPDETMAEEEPPKKARGRPRNTPLRAIPEAADEPSTSTSSTVSSTPKRGRSRTASNTSTTSDAVPTTPRRGRKAAVLEEVVEEEEEEEEVAATPRRSSRRLARQP